MESVPAIRIVGILGWAASLFVLSTVWSEPAPADPISVKEPVVPSVISDDPVLYMSDFYGSPNPDDPVTSDEEVDESEDNDDFPLWKPSNYRLEVDSFHHIITKLSARLIFNISPSVSDQAHSPSPEDDPSQPILARDRPNGRNANHAKDDPARSDPATQHGADHPDRTNPDSTGADDRSSAKATRTVSHYYTISLDGDVADTGLAAGAIQAINQYNPISLDGDAASTGLAGADRYKPISLDGDAAATGLAKAMAAAPPRRDATGSLGDIATWINYFLIFEKFVFSADALIYALLIPIVYVAFAGIHSLMRTSR